MKKTSRSFPRRNSSAEQKSRRDSSAKEQKKKKYWQRETLNLTTEHSDEVEEYEKKGAKGRLVLKIILVILIVILAVEVIGMAIRFIAPQSGAATFIDNQLNKVIRLITGDAADRQPGRRNCLQRRNDADNCNGSGQRNRYHHRLTQAGRFVKLSEGGTAYCDKGEKETDGPACDNRDRHNIRIVSEPYRVHHRFHVVQRTGLCIGVFLRNFLPR